MHNKPPGKGTLFRGGRVIIFTRFGRWVRTRVKIIEETDGVVPFQRDAFEGEPTVMGF